MKVSLISVALLLPFPLIFAEKLSPEDTKSEVDAINRILDAAYREYQVQVPAKLDESLLARRIYLKIGGRIPTHDEITSFLADKSENKKTRLINQLVDSPAYESQMFNWWADLLRLKTRMRGGNQIGAGQLYVHWVKEQIAKDVPFDRMAYDLVTAEGYPWENGAVGYYLRDAGMPLDNMSNTAQVFLGTQMVCAQCHNHPFDRWTQMEYYQMASYTYGITSTKGDDLQKRIRKHFETQNKHLSYKDKQKKIKSKEGQALLRSVQEILRPLRYGANHTDRKLTLPHDYQYDDGKPKAVVTASPIFGDELKVIGDQSKTQAYGSWLISPKNPRFTKVIANRMWKKVFGRGLVEPLDDWRDDTEASIPELLDHLEKLMVRVDYDLKEFQRILFQVKAFERASSSFVPDQASPYFFEAPLLERMSAEQIWDSLVTLSIPDADQRKQNSLIIEQRLRRFQEYQDKVYSLDEEKLVKLARQGATASKKINDRMEALQEQLGEAQEADDREAVARLRKEYGNARNQQRTVFAKLVMGPDFKVESLYGSENKTYPKDERWKGFNTNVYRASELQTPAQPGHFLREFGQSDRETADNSNRDASVPQALAFLNGTFYAALFNKNSPLMEDLTEAQSPEEKIEVLFLSILNRRASVDEMQACISDLSPIVLAPIQASGKSPQKISKEKRTFLQKKFNKGLAQKNFNENREYFALAWSLFNTRQFSFIQ